VAKAFVGSNPTPRTKLIGIGEETRVHPARPFHISQPQVDPEKKRLEIILIRWSRPEPTRRVEALFQRWVLIVILASALIPAPLSYAHGQAVNIVIGQDSVTLNMNLVLRENLTALPLVNTHLSMANSTNTVQPILEKINSAIQNQVKSASVSDLNININTKNNTKGTWLMDENYTIIVTGANTNSGSSITSNLGFIALNLTQPMQIGTTEINGVGATYLEPALEGLVAAHSNLVMFIDGSNPRTPLIPEQTTKAFWLLDFTWIVPVSIWTHTNDILEQSSEWSFNPPNTRYNLTLGVPSPEGPILAAYVATYSPSMSLTVPANAWVVNGNTVSYDIPTPAESIMPVIIVVSLAIAVVALILDRRLTRPIRARKKR